ncbi:MAG: hypothetical protein ACRD5G_08355 [Candidatus Acidiferrales bacterium]
MSNVYRIHAALHNEAKEGWAWISRDTNLTPSFIRIKNPVNGKTVVCERRTIDDNFRSVYNSKNGTIPLPEGGPAIVLNAFYREALGALLPVDTKSTVNLEISDANRWWEKYFLAPVITLRPLSESA